MCPAVSPVAMHSLVGWKAIVVIEKAQECLKIKHNINISSNTNTFVIGPHLKVSSLSIAYTNNFLALQVAKYLPYKTLCSLCIMNWNAHIWTEDELIWLLINW